MKRETTGSSATTPPGSNLPLDWARAHGAAEPVRAAVARHVRRRLRLRALLAGSGALVLLAVFFLAQPASPLRPTHAAPAVSQAASVIAPERRMLPDGSVLELRRETVVELDYQPHLRRVRLAHGAAHFEVAKDAQRPFVVEAAGFGVRAVGTAFAVELAGDAVEVIVTEGRVAVSDGAPVDAAGEGTLPHGASVGARERVSVEVAARRIAGPVAVTTDELHDRLAWRVPRLEFSGAPLAGVVTLFNAHARGRGPARLALADASLGALPLSGVLRADNVGVLLSILESSYGLQSRPGPAGEVIIFRP